MKPIYFVFLLAVLSLACISQAAPSDTGTVIKAPPVGPTAEKVMTICLTAESVRLRMGAGTSYGEVAILKSLDSVTVTGAPIVSEDMGVWMPITYVDKELRTFSGWVNARYLCEGG